MTDQDNAAVELTLTITTTNVAEALRVSEALHRAATGYALDGHETMVTILRLDHDGEEEDEPAQQDADDA